MIAYHFIDYHLISLKKFQLSRDLNHDEEQYLRDLNLIDHVFRRRFESAFGLQNKVKEVVKYSFFQVGIF